MLFVHEIVILNYPARDHSFSLVQMQKFSKKLTFLFPPDMCMHHCVSCSLNSLFKVITKGSKMVKAIMQI